MTRARGNVHVGCGTNNPFGKWHIRFAVWVPAAMSLLAITGSWWWELSWLGMPVLLSPGIWWEFVHRPSAMYRTWWP